MEKNIFELSEIDNYKSEWQEKKTVLVGGCFDILHYGHLSFLKKAQEAGEILIVALESDHFIRLRKKREPVHTQQQRAEMLVSLHHVDYVVLLPLMHNDADYARLVEHIRPSIIGVTEGDPNISNKKKHADIIQGHVVEVSPPLSTFSTSNIIYENIFSD